MKHLYKISFLLLTMASTSLVSGFDQSSPADSLVVDSLGKVGIGTSSPLSALHVKQDSASLKIEDTTAASAARLLLSLENNGTPLFRLTNSGTGKVWDFSQTAGGNFTISKSGSGGFEFTVFETGQVKMAAGPTVNFDLSPAGNLVIPNGSVTANGILLTSSRSSKTDFKDIKTVDVMEKLKQINVEEWRYKKADKNDRHFSPMAEDFYSLFQLGPNNKYINPSDLASVALIASKELQKKSIEDRSEILSLKADNAKLLKRLSSLEKLVTNLASSEGLLSEDAGKIALK